MLIKVISTKTVFGDKAALQRLVLSDEIKSHFIYRVMGEIQGFMQGLSRFKRENKETKTLEDVFWTKFAGDFVAINAEGIEYEAAICFIPDYVSGPFMETLKQDSDATVTFAFDIYVRYAKDSATSYEFVAQPIRPSGEISKAASMLSSMPALPGGVIPKQLAGPKKGK